MVWGISEFALTIGIGIIGVLVAPNLMKGLLSSGNKIIKEGKVGLRSIQKTLKDEPTQEEINEVISKNKDEIKIKTKF